MYLYFGNLYWNKLYLFKDTVFPLLYPVLSVRYEAKRLKYVEKTKFYNFIWKQHKSKICKINLKNRTSSFFCFLSNKYTYIQTLPLYNNLDRIFHESGNTDTCFPHHSPHVPTDTKRVLTTPSPSQDRVHPTLPFDACEWQVGNKVMPYFALSLYLCTTMGLFGKGVILIVDSIALNAGNFTSKDTNKK